MATAKKTAFQWCSRYCRLRDALDYCREHNIDLRQFARPEDIIAKCCTCEEVKPWIRMDAGHYIDRGSGGMSGVYFDERNINIQHKGCNAGFYRGKVKPDVKAAYETFMFEKYGQAVIDELHILDKTNSYRFKIVAIGVMYKKMYEELLKELQGE